MTDSDSSQPEQVLSEPSDVPDDAPAPAAPGAAAGDPAADPTPEQADPIAEAEAAATVEAILFSVDEPISPAKIAQVAELPRRRVKEAIYQLIERYEQMGCAFTVESIAGGFQMMTRPEYHDVLARLLKVRSESRLTNAALETLAVVAYRQPIIRADVESVRGVACGDMLRKLMDKNLVKIVGRAEVLGRPMLYGTTRHFLEVFGLNSLDDLPNVEQLRAPARPQESGQAEAEAQTGSEDCQADSQTSDPGNADRQAGIGEYRSESPETDSEPSSEPAEAEPDAEASED